MLQLKHVQIAIGDKIIIPDFSYTFEKGKVYAIMGPNGSGKSSLASAIMGNPAYSVKAEEMSIAAIGSSERVNLIDLAPEKRAEAGVFMSFQSPIALSGIRAAQLIQHALKGKKSALAIRKEVESVGAALHIPKELLDRSLNEGSSGGERKKMEVLQAAILDKPLQIFDEIDTGVDVDAMKCIAQFLEENKKDKTYIVITHYNRILKYLKPDKVLILLNGKLALSGDHTLAQKIENEGYKFVE